MEVERTVMTNRANPRLDIPLAASLLAILATVGCGTKPSEPTAAVKEITTEKTGIRMVLVPAGALLTGEEDQKEAPRKVQIDSFWIDKCEVTQESYERIVGKNPSLKKGPRNPVERVSWLDAINYCNLRSRREGLQPCYDLETLECNFNANGYRLPTEAEWEYACRAGSRTRYSFGNDASQLGDYAWFKGNAGTDLHPVGQKKPNAWGLHDVHGNVWEWCHDWYSEAPDDNAPAKNPTGPASGDRRVLRGGSRNSDAKDCRAASRSSETPGFADACFGAEFYGFRCVRKAE